MGDEFAWNDRYAGDGAWTEWFEICSVAGCRPEYAGRLAEQVSSAMYSQLARAGISRADTHGEDPVSFFDSYFKLRGSRDAKKPLKSYFLHRIKDEGIDMVDFVCGTLFGSGSGRIRDIVLDWISVLKGWKPRTVADGEGRRRIVWENAGDENLASVELSGASDALELLDEEPLAAEAARVLEAVARRSRIALDATSLLLYATSHDISLIEPCILSALGAGKTKVYSWRDKVMKALERELRSAEAGDTPLFARQLVASAAAHLPRSLREELGVDE
jgi:hypothetical protein